MKTNIPSSKIHHPKSNTQHSKSSANPPSTTQPIINPSSKIQNPTLNNRVAIIIPCYNEECSIKGVLEELSEVCPDYDYIVVNDCSRDRTVQAAEKCKKAVVIDLPVNLGIGGAVQTGFKYAYRKGYDYALKYDGDGQHRADEVELLLEPLFKRAADVVIGSRFLYEGDDGFKSTRFRQLGIKTFEIINSLLINQKVTDNTAGFRAYNREALRFLSSHYPSFDYPEPEEVVLLGKNGFKLTEVPVRMRIRQGGKSSLNSHILRPAYYMIKVIFAVFIVACRPKIRKISRRDAENTEKI